MPHRISKCTYTLYDYAIINYQYLCFMYELKKIGKVFTSNFVGTGPSSYKKNLPGRGLTRLRNTALDLLCLLHCITETIQVADGARGPQFWSALI